jgi:hypothetical protein
LLWIIWRRDDFFRWIWLDENMRLCVQLAVLA